MSIQNTLKALSDPTRREILSLLKEGRMSAGDITEKFPMTAAAVSRHLSVLRQADLIRDAREGKYIFYELNASVLEEIMLFIAELKGEKKNAQKIQKNTDTDLCDNHASDNNRNDFMEPIA